MTSSIAVLLGATLAVGGPALLSRVTAKTTPRSALFLLHCAVFSLLLLSVLLPASLVVDPHSPFGGVSAGIAACWEHLTHAPRELLGVVGFLSLGAVLLRAVVHGVRAYSRDRVVGAEHNKVLRILGNSTPGPGEYRTVLLTNSDPVAYCVRGRPSVIVATTGLRDRLSSDEYRAVLAHEAAHLRGCHHAVRSIWAALARTLPYLPLLTWGAQEVGHLLETRADDIAARRCGKHTVARALVAVATARTAVPASALAVTGGRVADRVQRLCTRRALPSFAACVGAVALPVIVVVLAVSLTAAPMYCDFFTSTL